MTGPEHYREAESALKMANDAGEDQPLEQYHLGRAQVHATLALAAATGGPLPENSPTWREVAGDRPQAGY